MIVEQSEGTLPVVQLTFEPIQGMNFGADLLTSWCECRRLTIALSVICELPSGCQLLRMSSVGSARCGVQAHSTTVISWRQSRIPRKVLQHRVRVKQSSSEAGTVLALLRPKPPHPGWQPVAPVPRRRKLSRSLPDGWSPPR